MEGAKKINFADTLGFLVILFLFGTIVVAVGIHLFLALYMAFGNPKPTRSNPSKEESEI
jgi:hypothetical protein